MKIMNLAERGLTGRHLTPLAPHRFNAQRNAGAKQGRPVCVQLDCYNTPAIVWNRHLERPASQAERAIHPCRIDGRVA